MPTETNWVVPTQASLLSIMDALVLNASDTTGAARSQVPEWRSSATGTPPS
jgi:hypothetical protein